MLVRRAAAASLLAAVSLSITPAPALAQSPPRVGILWMDGTTLAEWTDPDLPHLRALLGRASVALLSTRTEREAVDARALRISAAVTFGAGARGAGNPARGEPVDVEGVTPGLLGRALREAGRAATVVGDADGATARDRAAEVALATETSPVSVSDAGFPTGRRADIGDLARALGGAAGAGVVLVDPGDTARVEVAHGLDPDARARFMPQALASADAALGALGSALGPDGLLVVIAASPPVDRQRQGFRIGAIAIAGEGFPAGLLSSGTTRRPGVLSLTDVAPTILAHLGIAVPGGMDGRAARTHEVADAVAQARALEDEIITAARLRHPLTRKTLIGVMVVLVLAAAAVATGRAHRWARILRPLVVATTAVPLGLYVAGDFPADSPIVGLLAVGLFAIALGAGAHALLGARRALVLIFAASAAVPLVDLAIGTPMGVASPLAFQIAGGGRFYGVDDGVLGVVIAAEIFVLALAMRSARARPWALAALAAQAGVAVFLLGAPAIGSKFGAALTAIPPIAIVLVAAHGKRLSPAVLGAAFVLAGVVTAGFVGIDVLQRPEAQSHVARAAEGETDLGALLSRKIEATWRITVSTIWSRALLLFAVAAGFAAWRGRARFEAVLRAHALLGPGLIAAAVATVGGLVFQDGGVVTSVFVVWFAAAVTLTLMLEGPPDRAGRSRAPSA